MNEVLWQVTSLLLTFCFGPQFGSLYHQILLGGRKECTKTEEQDKNNKRIRNNKSMLCQLGVVKR